MKYLNVKYLTQALLSLVLAASCNNNEPAPGSQRFATADSTVSPASSSTATSAFDASGDSSRTSVPGPMPGAILTPEYVYQIGKQIYFWGWPLVNMHNRIQVMRHVPEPGLNGGAVPAAPIGRLCMLTDYITPAERYVACPNQDVIYGACWAMLNENPVVLQVPDFGSRFWVVQIGNQRTDGIGGLGAMYGSKAGFYLFVGPGWNGTVPAGITGVFHSNTNMAYIFPRAFLNNTPEDKKAIQPVINQLLTYPLIEFDGKMKTKDWTKIPFFPDPQKSEGGKEVAFVVPDQFFRELPTVLEEVPPLKGEEVWYAQIRSVLDAVKTDSSLYIALKRSANDAEQELIEPLRQFKNVGVPVGNYWNSTKNGADFGTDYVSRTGAARANIFVNQPRETIYYNQDRDGNGMDLNGRSNYTVTFSKEEIPKVKGFWSLTVYDANHFFYQNPDKVYSLGTKNKDLQYNPDGSLTLYLQGHAPGAGKNPNWLPVPQAKFTLLLRAYWPDESMVQAYTPPALKKIK